MSKVTELIKTEIIGGGTAKFIYFDFSIYQGNGWYLLDNNNNVL